LFHQEEYPTILMLPWYKFRHLEQNDFGRYLQSVKENTVIFLGKQIMNRAVRTPPICKGPLDWVQNAHELASTFYKFWYKIQFQSLNCRIWKRNIYHFFIHIKLLLLLVIWNKRKHWNPQMVFIKS
jgi:hypothetical protein